MRDLQASSQHFINNQKQRRRLARIWLIVTFVFCAFVVANETGWNLANNSVKAQALQKSITGTWTAGVNDGKISLNVVTQPEDGLFGTTIRLSPAELNGLPTPQALTAAAAKTGVNFRLAREAGTLSFDGYFQEGKGTGNWTFVSNRNYISAMHGLNFQN